MKIETKAGNLIDFLKRSMCKGTVTITPTEKINKYFFKDFLVETGDNMLQIRAADSEGGVNYVWNKLHGVEIIDGGDFTLREPQKFFSVMKRFSQNRKIRLELVSDIKMHAYTIDNKRYKGYEIDGNFVLSKDQLASWKENALKFINHHDKRDDGIPYMFADVKGERKEADYDCIVKLKKLYLSEVVDDSIDLGKEQAIKISMNKEGEFEAKTGKKNSEIKGRLEFEAEEIINPIEFDGKFKALQPIIPNLYDDVTLYMRKAKRDGKIKMWMNSQKGQIELNFITSQK